MPHVGKLYQWFIHSPYRDESSRCSFSKKSSPQSNLREWNEGIEHDWNHEEMIRSTCNKEQTTNLRISRNGIYVCICIKLYLSISLSLHVWYVICKYNCVIGCAYYISYIIYCRRRSPDVAVNCHSRMELRPPTARKSHPNFFAHCKRNTKMKTYKKTIIPNVQTTMRTQVTPMVSNYGKLKTKWHDSISEHYVNTWFVYVG